MIRQPRELRGRTNNVFLGLLKKGGRMKNPYLKNGRLADVISAITALGTYKFYKSDFEGWADRIGGSKDKAPHWRKVFEEHPEFFRISSGGDRASLVWRRQFPKTYDVDKKIDVPLPEGQKQHEDNDRLSRRPLEPSEITALISVASNLHDRALEQHKAGRWWVSLVTALLALLGALAGGWLSNANFAHDQATIAGSNVNPSE